VVIVTIAAGGPGFLRRLRSHSLVVPRRACQGPPEADGRFLPESQHQVHGALALLFLRGLLLD